MTTLLIDADAIKQEIIDDQKLIDTSYDLEEKSFWKGHQSCLKAILLNCTKHKPVLLQPYQKEADAATIDRILRGK